ncbi:hypothetical protein DV515_00014897 [Chloebia gouldiae]|uniref:Secreted protein n=1 Tax=Chloebia gouldiae TaxID=44316 RepID=A0A3L8RXB1_CHLGU|nr:hypothetical protein DV515_00014897 [Chloebia gouldiae]
MWGLRVLLPVPLHRLAFLAISLLDTRVEKKSQLPAQLNGLWLWLCHRKGCLHSCGVAVAQPLSVTRPGVMRFAAEVTHVLHRRSATTG